MNTKIGNALAHCIDRGDIRADILQAIELRAQEYLTSVRSGDLSAAWLSLSEATRASISREAFDELSRGIQSRLAKTAELHLHDVRLLTITGAYAGPAACGSVAPDDPNALVVSLRATDQRIAIVRYRLSGGPVGWVLDLRLDATSGDWWVAATSYSEAEYLGRDALQVLDLARSFDPRSHGLERLVALLLAHQLATPSGGLSTTLSRHTAGEIRTLSQSPGVTSALASLVEGVPASEVIYVGIVSTIGDMSLLVKILTPTDLTESDLAPEADAIAHVLRSQHSGIRTFLPNVLIEALNERPIDPGRAYPTYRLVRDL